MTAARKRKPRGKPTAHARIEPDGPIWYQPGATLGSAVRHVASLSGRFNWVGIYLLKGKTLELGPFIGEPTAHKKIAVGKGSELVVLVRDAKGKILGQIDIDSHSPDAFSPELEDAVKRVARELGERWHA